jgi:hypothetical protein
VFCTATRELQTAFLKKPSGQWTSISDFHAALEKPVGKVAAGFRKASCSSHAASQNLFAATHRL